MKKPVPFFAACLLSACATQESSQFDVGRREAIRLRITYDHWRQERPRKSELMKVGSSGVSNDARDAGFRDGMVDSQAVILFTVEGDDSAEGLVFGDLSQAEINGLKDLGFTLEATSQSGILSLKLKRTPNQLPDPTSPSVTPPAGAGGAPSVGADH